MGADMISVDAGLVERYLQRSKKRRGKSPGDQKDDPGKGNFRGGGNPKPPGQTLRKGGVGNWPANRIGSQGVRVNDWYGTRQFPGDPKGDQKDKKSTPTKEMIKRRLKKRNALDA